MINNKLNKIEIKTKNSEQKQLYLGCKIMN